MLRLCKFSLKNYAVKYEVDHFQEMVPYYVIKHEKSIKLKIAFLFFSASFLPYPCFPMRSMSSDE